MGPQSGGKSTLLNHLFKTNFRAMDSDEGRSQTTKGIWIAECAGIEPCTFVMDLEGTDGRERGEDDDTTFEKQSALFALAVSDIVLINMWCHDIGRDQAANRPLLKIVFEVMLKLFSQQKTTLMFIIRDKTKTPLEKLEPMLRTDIQRIWDSVQKPDAHKETSLSEFFNVEVVALCNFERDEVEFKEQVDGLRKRFFHSKSPGGLAGDRQGVVPGSGFSLSAQQMWEVIKENRDLDLPSHKVLVATVRCEEIANEKYDSFVKNENWCQLEDSVKTEAVSGFGQRFNSIFDSCLSEYDMEVAYFDARVRSARRKELERKIMLIVDPVFQLMLVHISSETFEGFKKALEDSLKHGKGFSASVRDCTDSLMAQFDSKCADASFHQANWFECRNNFQLRIDAHTGEVRAGQLVKLNASYEKNLSQVLSEGVGALLNEANSLTWPTIRSLLHDKTTSAVLGMTAELASFDMDEQSKAIMLADMEEHARRVVLLKAKDEAGRVLILMKDRFLKIFIHDNVNIQHLNQLGRSASLKILVVLAAAPMDDEEDNIMKRFTTLSDEALLASETWEQISLSTIYITPYQCHDYWMQFCSWANIIVSNATPAPPVQVAAQQGPVEMFFGVLGGAIDKVFGHRG